MHRVREPMRGRGADMKIMAIVGARCFPQTWPSAVRPDSEGTALLAAGSVSNPVAVGADYRDRIRPMANITDITSLLTHRMRMSAAEP